MTSIPIDRSTDSSADTAPPAQAELSLRARARGGTLTPINGSGGGRFDRTAVLELVRPPDVWSDARPSLRSQWLYAVYGQWTGERTLGRRLGVAYAVLVSMPLHAVGYLALWVFERPSRALVAALVAVLTYLAFAL